MDLVLIVSLGGLEKGKVIGTCVGRRIKGDFEPLSLDEEISWYSRFSSGDLGFRKWEKRASIQEQANLNSAWARNAWGSSSYGISYYVVSEEESRRLINSHKAPEDYEDD